MFDRWEKAEVKNLVLLSLSVVFLAQRCAEGRITLNYHLLHVCSKTTYLYQALYSVYCMVMGLRDVMLFGDVSLPGCFDACVFPRDMEL